VFPCLTAAATVDSIKNQKNVTKLYTWVILLASLLHIMVYVCYVDYMLKGLHVTLGGYIKVYMLH
jgi:hypothetical protein